MLMLGYAHANYAYIFIHVCTCNIIYPEIIPNINFIYILSHYVSLGTLYN